MNGLVISGLLVLGICALSGVGACLLKLAADNQSWGIFWISTVTYSFSSLLLFWLFQFRLAESFALTMFLLLICNLLAVQVISLLMGEPFRFRVFAVLLIALAAFGLASADTPQSNSDPSNAESNNV